MLGDYIDRGPDSKAIIDFVISLKKEGYDITSLMGNHEDMMLKAGNSGLDNYNWMMNGGEETLKSFNAVSVNDIDDKYLKFLSSMPKYHIIDDYIFVHGGFNDEIDDPFSDEHSMIWERRFEYKSPVLRNKIIIHGHRPHPLAELQEELKNNPSVINIDTGCVYGKERGLGDLTALDVLTMNLYSVSCNS